MSGDAARSIDPEFPHLAADVVAGYRHAPATMVAEVIDGALSLLPRPRPRHALSATALAGDLRGPFGRGRGGPGGWVFLIEPELWLGSGPDILVPDLAGWRRERLTEAFLDPEGVGITLAPDWVCEVLSPSTAHLDRKQKLPIYRRERVGHAWLVDPSRRELEVFRWAPEGWLLIDAFQGDESVRAEPFDAVPLELAALWNL